MKLIAQWSKNERQELFLETSAELGVTPAIIEKDFWVTWTLAALFSDDILASQLMFKGGTSLSKVYGVIERFSEDIDLILNWESLSQELPAEQQVSKSQDSKVGKALNFDAQGYIAKTLLDLISQRVEPICTVRLDDDPYVINVRYPSLFTDDYLRPEIRLEIGPMAAWSPHQQYQVTSLAAKAFPNLFKEAFCDVNVILAKRTFWEKATILHAEAHRPDSSKQPMRYSRHYYDLAKLATSNICEEALDDIDLLDDVVVFKKRFYQSSWAHYQTAKPGSFRLVPNDAVLQELRKDYQAMRNMIYGDYPDFDVMITILLGLEEAINAKTVRV
jgi:hypothetical protein